MVNPSAANEVWIKKLRHAAFTYQNLCMADVDCDLVITSETVCDCDLNLRNRVHMLLCYLGTK